ncbi:hypothetical protein ON010_g11361 [Phytophthora cinnamomi]|nr:hypothetical protein ON010_g11361 [Phytophthora cinnamomi]
MSTLAEMGALSGRRAPAVVQRSDRATTNPSERRTGAVPIPCAVMKLSFLALAASFAGTDHADFGAVDVIPAPGVRSLGSAAGHASAALACFPSRKLGAFWPAKSLSGVGDHGSRCREARQAKPGLQAAALQHCSTAGDTADKSEQMSGRCAWSAGERPATTLPVF